ncbi:hypothetical protein [Streptomyces decoyicus]|uniref:hypothetical protein n=1 Tax=Streptomyces decoyicus TaxID=249567 RepID=UPI003C12C080
MRPEHPAGDHHRQGDHRPVRRATVTTFWDGGYRSSFTAYVGLESRPIVLQDVDCGQ